MRYPGISNTTTKSLEALANDVVVHLRTFPDFPRQGVNFLDLCPVFAQQQLLSRLASAVVTRFEGGFDAVLAVEARGFVFGTAVAQTSARPLLLARKPGKLPGSVHSVQYSLEYGEACLEMQYDALVPGTRVLVVDDILATGGTLSAAGQLVALEGGEVAGYAVVVAIAGLGGRTKLEPFEPFVVVTTSSSERARCD